jgi:hypothetical protein
VKSIESHEQSSSSGLAWSTGDANSAKTNVAMFSQSVALEGFQFPRAAVAEACELEASGVLMFREV